MSIEKRKKIGFFFALMMLIGSVVGIGIFFKNFSVSKATGGDGWSWLVAWVLGGLISLATAISFAECSRFKKTRLSGLSSWAYKVGGTKFGYGVSLTYSFFYFGILFISIGVFVSEIFYFFLGQVGALDFEKVPLYVIVLTGILFGLLFLILNDISLKASGIIQSIITFIKFIPLLVAIVAGIVMFKTNNIDGSFNAFTSGKTFFSIKGIIIALPSILFAYDAFLIAGSIGNKIKNARKNLFWIILLGMSSVVILYSLVAISSILHNQGFVWGLLQATLSTNVQKNIVAGTTFFILVSSYGVLNGISLGFKNEISNLISTNGIFASKTLKSKIGTRKTEWIYIIVTMTIWSVVLFVPSLILNHDKLIDGMSNFPTIFFFVVYALVIFLYTIKRHKLSETGKINNILFYCFAAIAILGIVIVEFSYIVAMFTDLFNLKFVSSWGVFKDGGKEATIARYIPLVLYIIFYSTLVTIPFLNYFLEKVFFKRNIIQEFALTVEDVKENNESKNEVINLNNKEEILKEKENNFYKVEADFLKNKLKKNNEK